VTPEQAERRAAVDDTTTRRTRQRRQVLALLDETEEFRSAQQLHALLGARDTGIGLATVYRTLRLLAEAGEVAAVRQPSGQQMFRRCDSGRRHHHHLVCRSCGRTVEVAGPAVGTWAQEVAAEHGYCDAVHTLEILGTCPRCAAADASGQ
jgi:Fur family ferric uptake transcriptional regulator